MNRLVVDDPAAAAAERIAAAVGQGGHIVLAGGSTPQQAYERVAAMNLDWSRCTVWFGDERCVPPEHELSNYGMARAALLGRLADAAPTVHRMQGELGPRDGADAYEQLLREQWGEGMPRTDLMLLGLGPDAHCASLFPGDAALDEQQRWAVGVQQSGLEPWVSRITLTLPAINAAREVLFIVGGSDKAEAVARAFGGQPRRDAPASLVSPVDGTLTVLLDEDAAALLPSEARP